MNLNMLPGKNFFFIPLLAWGLHSYSQDTANTFIGFSAGPFSHSAYEKDQQLFGTAAYLIDSEPTGQNHKTYYLLACSLWELNKIDDAQKMFLKIIGSTQPWYESTYYHSSDIPG